MMVSRFGTVGVLVAAAALSVSACGSSKAGGDSNSSGSTSTKPINVLVIQALSGPLGASGTADVQGMKAAASVINAHGGVNGRQLKLNIQDDAGDPTKAVSLLQKAIDSGKTPDVLEDGTTSAESLAMAPLVKDNKIFAVSAGTGLATVKPDGKEDISTHPTKFTTSVSLNAVSSAMVSYLKSKSYTKVAVLAASDAYGKSWQAAYTAAITAAGMQVSASASFDATALDVTPQLQKLQASKPDVLIAEAYAAATGYVLNSREKLGWTNTPMVGAVTFSVSDLTKVADASAFANVKLESLKVQQYVAPAQRTATLSGFISAVQAQGPVTTALSAYAFPYDSLILAAAAISKAGTTNGAKVSAAMENVGTTPGTVIQPDYFTPTNHYPTSDPSAFVFISPGPLVDGMIKTAS